MRLSRKSPLAENRLSSEKCAQVENRSSRKSTKSSKMRPSRKSPAAKIALKRKSPKSRKVRLSRKPHRSTIVWTDNRLSRNRLCRKSSKSSIFGFQHVQRLVRMMPSVFTFRYIMDPQHFWWFCHVVQTLSRLFPWFYVLFSRVAVFTNSFQICLCLFQMHLSKLLVRHQSKSDAGLVLLYSIFSE